MSDYLPKPDEDFTSFWLRMEKLKERPIMTLLRMVFDLNKKLEEIQKK